VIAVPAALWDDADGVRVSIDWQAGTDDMTTEVALALADALCLVASLPRSRAGGAE
jgi:hypothetical protein